MEPYEYNCFGLVCLHSAPFNIFSVMLEWSRRVLCVSLYYGKFKLSCSWNFCLYSFHLMCIYALEGSVRRACPHLYTTLPHNLIKEKLLDMIEWTFKRALKTMVHFIWPVMTEKLFPLLLTKVDTHFGHVRIYVTPYPIS